MVKNVEKDLNSFDVGEIVEIHCYKHNGKIHRIWEESTVIEENEEYLVCGNFKTKVIENDGRSHRTKEPAIIFFYKKSWFNIIAQFKEFGLFYYCNIASPYLNDEDTIKYIDYDLDLRVFPNGTYKVLDRNEYNFHKKIMKYPKPICDIVERELKKLIHKKELKEDIFNEDVVKKYLKKFEAIGKQE